ncbi:NUDIX domain-containing protein [Paenibacillus sp. MMS20-IR301]|uniref:NUDIX hydrolase n=1 Tax=Paenibacillus sp. MMS20-IR301 TaxID=2895946 RepID=UPI0028F07E45|nr:NUDIX domain-containing protein [Paenibacillus sp. MMS20-IR301]WNS44881.1 NUDIX domain-containing protein [Paenibacillus sp. MMS20-IR301]
MNKEILTTFDEQGHVTGTAPRDEVHRLGLWHETFHCWFVGKDDSGLTVYLQLRSTQKRDYAGLLDITAAGHLTAGETVQDGVREVQEELGLALAFDELKPLGIIPYCMDTAGFLDRERANVFIYENRYALEDFVLQQEEVAGIVQASFSSFRSLITGAADTLRIQGFRITADGERVIIDEQAGFTRFVPHEQAYYLQVIKGIEALFR